MSMATRWFSLRRRLVVWLLAGVTVGWLTAVGVAYVDTHDEVVKLLEKRGESDKLGKKVQKELAEHLLLTMLTPLLIGLPVLGAWIWFITWRGLRPLNAIATEVGQRAPERLGPVSPPSAPREVRPLIEALNALFFRVDQAMERERAFTADAAHELRTPLAALATQAQVAARAADAAERDHALDQLIQVSTRASRLVDQLLTLARLDPAARSPLAPLRLDELAAAECADHGATAVDKQLDLELAAPAAVSLTGHADLLRVLLRNLLDNAIRYTPPGGRIRVAVQATPAGSVLTVSDSGPGIPVAQRAAALQRFHRLAGQDVEGSGLGLSIVARIAELHNAQLTLGDGIGAPGLAVTVTFTTHA